ncbi:MAG: Senescence marker protein-30 [Eubacterium sp.]|jgi:D-xylonolactonase|nr:Senescence marker protein-30 [Eubacterium sp.]
MNNNLECIHGGICHLGEGPLWNTEQQKLFWTDIYNRRIWVYDTASGSSTVFWEGEHQVGGFAFTKTGSLVLCTDKGVFHLKINFQGILDREPELLFEIPLQESEMFNDITVDPRGRIFAGTLVRSSFTGGTLYRLEKGKKPEIVLKGLYCSNGMTFSRDLKYFYHTDSTVRRITKYEYDIATGNIERPKVYYQGSEATGSPDGITLDSENHVWAAFWGGGRVKRIDPSGKVVEEVAVPARQPSSVMFGGKGLEELYITSAAENADNIITGYCSDGTFAGGPVYRLKPGVTGREEWLADF